MARAVAARPSAPAALLSRPLASAIIGLLCSLIATGIVSMVSLYSHVETLTEDVRRTEVALGRHLEHSVDRDEWLRRDAQVQRSIDAMATKDDLVQLRAYLGEL